MAETSHTDHPSPVRPVELSERFLGMDVEGKKKAGSNCCRKWAKRLYLAGVGPRLHGRMVLSKMKESSGNMYAKQ